MASVTATTDDIWRRDPMGWTKGIVVAAVAASCCGGIAGAAEPVTIGVAPSPAAVETFDGGPCYLGELQVTQPAGFNVTRSGSTAEPLTTTVQNGHHVLTSDVVLPPTTVTVTFPVNMATVFVPRRAASTSTVAPTRWTLSTATATGSFDGYAPPSGGGANAPCDLVDETIDETILVNVLHPGEQPFAQVHDFVLRSGSLPPGMAVDPESGPAGTPTALGNYTAVVEVCPFPKLGEVVCGDRTYRFSVVAELPPGTVERIAGPDRIATAIAASQGLWAADAAGAVVLARADTFPDALVGGPLAHHVAGPLLLTGSNALDPRVRAEIDRVLEPGDRVLLLGGIGALALAIEDELNDVYTVRRFAGATRYATAVAVALGMGTPRDVLLADGTNFPDALVAGAAASSISGAVLLTNGSALPVETGTYLDAADADPIAIGGPAAAAVPTAPAVVGPDRYRTAIGVAGQFFPAAGPVGVATGQNFPDALAGAAHIATLGGPLLLTPGEAVNPDLAGYLEFLDDPTRVFLYGGTAAISRVAENGIRTAVDAPIVLE